MTTEPVIHIHRPKVELFNLSDLTNTDPKGIVRSVDHYRVHPWGLYMARHAPGHSNFHYLESWFIPNLGIRATVFHFHREADFDQDYYLDIGEFAEIGPTLWRSVDYYLDIVVRTGRETELLDVDELIAAVGTGVLDQGAATVAVERAAAAIDGIARHGYRLEDWLATLDITLTRSQDTA